MCDRDPNAGTTECRHAGKVTCAISCTGPLSFDLAR